MYQYFPKGGHTEGHGGKSTCSHEGCTTIAQNGGVCRRHDAKVKKYRSQRITRDVPSKPRYEGCVESMRWMEKLTFMKVAPAPPKAGALL